MSDEVEGVDTENPSAYPSSVQAGIPKLGVTPKGWARLPLRDLLRRVERPAKLVNDETYQLVTAKRSRGGIVAREVLRGDQIRTKTQFYVEAGDFLISNRQISHGACGIVPANLHRAIVSNEYTTLHPSDALDLRFLNALSHSVYFQQTCFHSSIGVHVEKLVFRLEDWLGWEFDIPPLSEQCRVVAVLDAWNRAIDQTERLTAVKRRRKTALLQKFLSNLPKRPLLEAVEVWFSGVDKKSSADEIPILLCNYMDVFHNTRITSRIDFMRATASSNEIKVNSLRKNDVIFTKDSETAEEIAQPALVANDIENLVCGYHLAVARPHDGVGHGPFIAQAMRHPEVRRQFCRVANGVMRFGLTLDAIEEAEIFLPGMQIQEQIATVLDAEDLIIEGLSNYTDYLRNQKRGLVQKLLAGKWRLDHRFDRSVMPQVALVGTLA